MRPLYFCVNRVPPADDHSDLGLLIPKTHGGTLAICDVLELLGTPALFVDSALEVVGMNRAAESHLGDEVCLRGNRITANDRTTNQELSAMLERAVHGDPSCATDPLIVPRRSIRPLIVQALPLAQRAAILFHPARALVIIFDPIKLALPTERTLAHILGLSRAEARLTIRLAAGDNLQAAARAGGIAYETARKQLKMVFAKTHTSRQAELVSLIIRIGTLPACLNHSPMGKQPMRCEADLCSATLV